MYGFFPERLQKPEFPSDNRSMRSLIFTILVIASVLLALLLWSPTLSTGDHPPSRLVSASVLR